MLSLPLSYFPTRTCREGDGNARTRGDCFRVEQQEPPVAGGTKYDEREEAWTVVIEFYPDLRQRAGNWAMFRSAEKEME